MITEQHLARWEEAAQGGVTGGCIDCGLSPVPMLELIAEVRRMKKAIYLLKEANEWIDTGCDSPECSHHSERQELWKRIEAFVGAQTSDSTAQEKE